MQHAINFRPCQTTYTSSQDIPAPANISISRHHISLGEITSKQPRRVIIRRPQLLRRLERIDRRIRLALRHLIHVVAADTIQAQILNDHRMPAGAAVLDIGAIAGGIPPRVPRRRAHGLDARARFLAEPHEEHGFDGGEVADGGRVVAFGDALAVGAVEHVVAHDPAAALAVGGFGRVAGGVRAGGPGRGEPGGVVGVLGEAGVPGVVCEGGVPEVAEGVHFVEGGGGGGARAGGRVPGIAAGGVAGAAGGAGGGVAG